MFSPGHRVVLGVLRGAEDHGDPGRFGIGFQELRHPKAAHLAHHNVQQDQRIAFGMHPEGLLGAVCHVGFVAFDFEVELQDFAQRLFIVDHQDFVFCHKCGFESAANLRIIHRCCMPRHDI